MPLPHRAVACSIIESYLNMRAANWKLVNSESGRVTLPTDEKPAKKIEHCVKLLKKIQAAKNAKAWIDILFDIAEVEMEENNNRHYAIVEAITGAPLLLSTLMAVRSYIVSVIKTEKEFLEEKDSLRKQIADIENAISVEKIRGEYSSIGAREKDLKRISEKLYILNDEKTYYKEYFNEILKVKDRRPAILNEDTFEDYVDNAKNEIRKLDLCSKVISIYSKLNKDEPSSAPVAASKDKPEPEKKASPVKTEKEEKKPEPLKVTTGPSLFIVPNQANEPPRTSSREKKPSLRRKD